MDRRHHGTCRPHLRHAEAATRYAERGGSSAGRSAIGPAIRPARSAEGAVAARKRRAQYPPSRRLPSWPAADRQGRRLHHRLRRRAAAHRRRSAGDKAPACPRRRRPDPLASSAPRRGCACSAVREVSRPTSRRTHAAGARPSGGIRLGRRPFLAAYSRGHRSHARLWPRRPLGRRNACCDFFAAGKGHPRARVRGSRDRPESAGATHLPAVRRTVSQQRRREVRCHGQSSSPPEALRHRRRPSRRPLPLSRPPRGGRAQAVVRAYPARMPTQVVPLVGDDGHQPPSCSRIHDAGLFSRRRARSDVRALPACRRAWAGQDVVETRGPLPLPAGPDGLRPLSARRRHAVSCSLTTSSAPIP